MINDESDQGDASARTEEESCRGDSELATGRNSEAGQRIQPAHVRADVEKRLGLEWG